MAKYIKNGTKYTVSVAYSQDRRQQRLDAICAEEQVNLYYPTVLGISQAITNYAIGQPSSEIYYGTIMKEWGRAYPDGQDEFNQILDILVETGFLKKGKTADNPPIVTYSSVDDLERRQRMEAENARVRESMRKTRENKKTEAHKLENWPEETETEAVPDIQTEAVPDIQTEDVPDIQTEEQREPEETETERKPYVSPPELSGFEAKLKAFGGKDFRKSKSNPPLPPTDDLPWAKHADSVRTKCEQEEAEQPDTTSQGQFYAGRGGYWDDCVT